MGSQRGEHDSKLLQMGNLRNRKLKYLFESQLHGQWDLEVNHMDLGSYNHMTGLSLIIF